MKVLHHAGGLPLGLLARKAAAQVLARVRNGGKARRDARDGTYLEGARAFVPAELPQVVPDEREKRLFRALAARYAAHEFDLLGSGWIRVAGPPEGDRLPPGCRAESRRIRSLIGGPYAPIDWHCDFKAGTRWSERTWHKFVPYGLAPGVDVKVPWELARMQHVPVLALAARSAAPEEAALWRAEAMHQMLDFVAANPPRFGVNWRTAMDVGIRAANMALAMDLLAQDGALDERSGVLARSLEEHALHIRANLEWSPNARGNHYLANVAGVLWCATHLEPSPTTDEWIAWGVGELVAETERQFLADGSNFEASVCYHRLSAEMVAWSAACASGPGGRFGVELGRVRARLPGMAAFMRWAAKPDGRAAQIGDNDSGRFFRLPGAFDGEDEQPLLHAETLDVLDAVAGRRPATAAGRLAQGLAAFEGEATPHTPMASFGVAGDEGAGPSGQEALWSFGEGCWDGLETAAFPDFGLFVWRSRRVWLAVRCGSVGQGGLGGHAHNDALHVELAVDGKPWIADPGTGVYTPDPRLRNRYRSAAVHFVPRPAASGASGPPEPAPLDRGLFRLDECGARCHRFGPEGFVGSHDGYGARMWRRLELTADGVRVRDLWEGGPCAPIPHVDAQHPWRPVPFSPGYGRFET